VLAIRSFVLPAEGVPPLGETAWQRGKREAAAFANGRAIMFMIISAPIFGIAGANLFSFQSFLVRSLVGALLGLLAGLVIAFGFAATFAIRAPYKQRDDARSKVLAENERFTQAEKKHKELYDQNDRNWRKAFDDKWNETEDLRGQLGEAQATIRELRARGFTLADEVPNIATRLITCWEDKEFDHPDSCKFGAEIEATNRELQQVSVRFALIFSMPSMHSESEQTEPPIQLPGRSTDRATVHFFFPKMFVDPFRSEDGGRPHASKMKLAIRELVSDTESVIDVRT
jgi:hypothetical protein